MNGESSQCSQRLTPTFLMGISAVRWYFDVASTSSVNETVTVVFFERGPTGFLGDITPDNTLSVQISGTLKNGTPYNIEADASPDASAVINTSDNAIHGDWQTTGFRFFGTEGGKKYIVSINSPEHDIFGTIVFRSVCTRFSFATSS